MDNKKLYKRISTCFWFIFATLPIWVILIGYIGGFFVHTDGLTSASDISAVLGTYNFGSMVSRYGSYFVNYMPNFIYDLFNSLFRSFSILQQYRDFLTCFCGWFVWVYFIELMVDFIVWLPKFFHSLLDKGAGKID